MGNNINSAKNNFRFIKKSQIKQDKGDDIMTYYENIKKTVESQSTNKSMSSKLFKRFMPTSISQFNLMSNNKLKKLDSYIKSPQYMQRVKLIKLKAQNVYEKFNNKGNSQEEGFIKQKLFSFKNPFSLAKDLTKKKFRRFLIYFSLFMICYSLLKYLKYRLYRTKEDTNLTQILNLVNDLRKQNDELIKQNKELVDKIMKDR